MSDSPKQLWERTKDLVGDAVATAKEAAKEKGVEMHELGKRALDKVDDVADAARGKAADLIDKAGDRVRPEPEEKA